jgi:hypothetical protein
MDNRIYQMIIFTMFLATIGCVSIALWKPQVIQSVVPVQTTATVPDLQNNVSLQRECAELFKTILEIQDNREQFRTQLGTIQEAFSAEQIGEQKMTLARRVWLRNENALASEAADLYSSGREQGCFQRVTE